MEVKNLSSTLHGKLNDQNDEEFAQTEGKELIE